MKKTFFEITDAVNHIQRHTTVNGIQRVVFSILEALKTQMDPISDGEAFFISFIDPKDGRHQTIRLCDLLDFDLRDAEALRHICDTSNRKVKDLPPSLRKYANRPLKLNFHRLNMALRSQIRGPKNKRRHDRTALADWPKSISTEQIKHREQIENQARPKRTELKDCISQGDEMLILGAFWDFASLFPTFETLKQKGVVFRTLIHDLIPIRSPQYVDREFSCTFLNYFEKLRLLSNSYFTVSNATKVDLKLLLSEYEDQSEVSVLPLVQHFASGTTDLDTKKYPTRAFVQRAAQLRRDVLLAPNFPYVLCVGTLEARKNNWGLLQAWARLLDTCDHDVPRLVFAGKLGVHNQTFFNALEETRNLDGWLQIVENPSDEELAHLYKNCEFSVFPSFYEGWGLPVGEALSFGKTGVVANNSSLPEVGSDLVMYCEARSIKEIAESCRGLIEEPEKRKGLENRISQTRLRNWQDVSNDLVEALR